MLQEAKAYPIENILEETGCKKGRSGGGKIMYSSPFSSDSNPSFCVYLNTNTFHDFSSGLGGDGIDLYMKLKSCSFTQAIRELSNSTDLSDIECFINSKQKKEEKENNFFKNTYITSNKDSVKRIDEYAKSRCITNGYYPSIIADYSSGEKVNREAIMFVHFNSNKEESGAKFRFINPDKDGARFTARGSLGIYILENIVENHFSKPCLFIVESETSANSLFEFMKSNYVNGVVFSMGGVSKKLIDIPKEYSLIENKFLIIDYDGDEEKYVERIKFHGDIARPIKLPLEKGEDLNSIYCNGKIKEFKNLIFKNV